MKSTAIRPKIDASRFTSGSCGLALKGRRNRPEQGEQGMTLVLAGANLAVGLAGLGALLGTSINEVKRGHTASGTQGSTSIQEHGLFLRARSLK